MPESAVPEEAGEVAAAPASEAAVDWLRARIVAAGESGKADVAVSGESPSTIARRKLGTYRLTVHASEQASKAGGHIRKR